MGLKLGLSRAPSPGPRVWHSIVQTAPCPSPLAHGGPCHCHLVSDELQLLRTPILASTRGLMGRALCTVPSVTRVTAKSLPGSRRPQFSRVNGSMSWVLPALQVWPPFPSSLPSRTPGPSPWLTPASVWHHLSLLTGNDLLYPVLFTYFLSSTLECKTYQGSPWLSQRRAPWVLRAREGRWRVVCPCTDPSSGCT